MVAKVSYEASVNWMRGEAQYAEMIKLCYLDRDNLAAAQRFAASEEFRATCDLLGIDGQQQVPPQVLDLGCGNGIASYAFAQQGCAVVAVDPDDSHDVGLRAAARIEAQITRGSIALVQARAEALPFPDNSFDVVYERQALHHFSDLLQGLAESARVLKPGGLFLATREHVVSDDAQLESFLAGHILHQLHGGENAYRVGHYEHCLKGAGLMMTRRMAPLDNVINHFPMSNADVQQAFGAMLRSKLGGRIGGAMARSSRLESAYRGYKSWQDRTPGRLYSFLCTKRYSQ
jgi:SAM-dependent methyltransferase